MSIDQIIFGIIKDSAHNWVRYWISEKISGMTMPGEYIELRSSYISDKTLKDMLESGFKIEKISSMKINADSYCDVLLKREFGWETVQLKTS